MLRTSAIPLLHSVAVAARTNARRSSSPFLLATVNGRRSLTSSTSSKEALKLKPVDEDVSKGTEGLHRADTGVVRSHDAPHQSDIPVIGDWVLFHPVYSPEEMRAVKIVHRDQRTFSDKFAASLMRVARIGFDLVSGYKYKVIPPDSKMSVPELRQKGYIMNEKEWMNRILFLETIAGIPGMVAATIRHLQSLRLMKRDGGWIHTLLEEAENERMHLMTFMTLRKPGIFFRTLVLGAQGVYYNLFFLSYLISPATCHRFVGYLEEEAVRTYTHCVEEIESGRFPEWENRPAPSIARDYWRLPHDATMLDVVYAVRSDESTHRFVNHSLANLDVKNDVNPFVFREPDMFVKGTKYGLEREEAEEYVQESRRIIHEQEEKEHTVVKQ